MAWQRLAAATALLLLVTAWPAPPLGEASGAPVSLATPGGAVIFTFDNGYAGHVSASSVLESKGYRGTFYVISQNLRSGPYYTAFMSAQEVAGLASRGHDVGSNTVTYPDLTTVDATRLQSELANSKSTLQTITGKGVAHLAYPYGATDANVMSATAQHYKTGRVVTTNVDEFTFTHDTYRLPALLVTRSTTLATAQGYVDFAQSRGVTVILQFSNITSTPGGNDWTPTDLTSLVNYVASKGVNVRTMSQAFGAAGAVAPSAPTLSAIGANARVDLSWTVPPDGGSGITGFNVYRGTSSGGESLLVSLGFTTSYSDAAVSNGVAYYYRVAAGNSVGIGALSNEARVVPSAAPPPPAGTVVFTFDDALTSQLDAAKKLEDRGWRATFFIPSGWTGKSRDTHFSSRDVQTLARKGHDIEAHSIDHVDLTTLSATERDRQLRESQAKLRDLTGQSVNHMAYPFGGTNDAVKANVAKYYASARAYDRGLPPGGLTYADRYDLPGVGITSAMSVADVRRFVDLAITQRTTVVLVFHRINDAPLEFDWTPSKFDALLAYVATQPVTVRTYAQAMG